MKEVKPLWWVQPIPRNDKSVNVAVKPLEWLQPDQADSSFSRTQVQARSCTGLYRIERPREDLHAHALYLDDEFIDVFDCVEEGIAHAQDLFEFFIRSTLVPVPFTDELLEQMARAHDREEAAQKGEPDPWADDFPDEMKSERIAAMRAAFAVYVERQGLKE